MNKTGMGIPNAQRRIQPSLPDWSFRIFMLSLQEWLSKAGTNQKSAIIPSCVPELISPRRYDEFIVPGAEQTDAKYFQSSTTEAAASTPFF